MPPPRVGGGDTPRCGATARAVHVEGNEPCLSKPGPSTRALPLARTGGGDTPRCGAVHAMPLSAGSEPCRSKVSPSVMRAGAARTRGDNAAGTALLPPPASGDPTPRRSSAEPSCNRLGLPRRSGATPRCDGAARGGPNNTEPPPWPRIGEASPRDRVRLPPRAGGDRLVLAAAGSARA